MDIKFGDPSENFKEAERLIDAAASIQADIAVLPELWTTGYDLRNLNKTADYGARESLAFFSRMAEQHGMHIVGGSVANRTDNGVENTMLVVDKGGIPVLMYSKSHLFKLMDEHLYLTAGSGKGNFELDGRQLAGLICYDIRFPEWIRAHTATGAELLFVVAEWPLKRVNHWRALLIARAIENQCYVVACNRIGSDPNNVFAGHSMVIDPLGDVVAEAGEGAEILTAEIDLEKVVEVRKQIPVFTDRRPDLYN